MFNISTWLYTNPSLYRLTMRLLYGRYFEARYAAIAAEIPSEATVVDVCAGDGYLFRKYLRQRGVDYLGLDLSPQLVRWANQHGTVAREFDLWQDEVPAGEIVVMQSSLYQFIPHAKDIVHKLLAAASQKVIISEPVRNFAESRNPVLAGLSRHLTRPASSHAAYNGQRFNQQTLTVFFQSFAAFDSAFIIPGEREMVGIFKGYYGHCREE